MARLNSEKCGRICDCNTYLFLLATRISPASPNFGQAKQGQKFVVPTFHIHFLNPECVRIPWVLAPKNFPVENSCHQWRGQGSQAYDLPVCYFGERSLPMGPLCLQQCFSFEIAYSFICIMQSGIISAYLKWERVSGGLTGSSF